MPRPRHVQAVCGQEPREALALGLGQQGLGAAGPGPALEEVRHLEEVMGVMFGPVGLVQYLAINWDIGLFSVCDRLGPGLQRGGEAVCRAGFEDEEEQLDPVRRHRRDLDFGPGGNTITIRSG